MPGRKVLDNRQAKFLELYLDPDSETFDNALQSGLKAGFTQEYSESITSQMPDWLSEALGRRDQRRKSMLEKAERNLNEFLDLNPVVPAMGMLGPIIDKKTKKPLMKLSPEILKVKEKVTEFVAETLGKEHYGKGPQVAVAVGVVLKEEEKERIDRIFAENQAK